MAGSSDGIWPHTVVGDRRNPAILFLHGLMGMRADWAQIASALSPRYYCIMPDLPGHGDNVQGLLSQTLTLDRLADGLLVLLDHLSLEKVSLVGYSMGGRIALHFAVSYREKLTALVLESANPGITDADARGKRRALDDARAQTILEEGLEAFVDEWYSMQLFASLYRHGKRSQDLVRLRKKNDPRWIAKAIWELSPGRQTPLWDRLPSLEVPALLIAGEEDTKYSKIVVEMAGGMKDATAVVIPNVGHVTHWEAPEEFCQALLNFL